MAASKTAKVQLNPTTAYQYVFRGGHNQRGALDPETQAGRSSKKGAGPSLFFSRLVSIVGLHLSLVSVYFWPFSTGACISRRAR